MRIEEGWKVEEMKMGEGKRWVGLRLANSQGSSAGEGAGKWVRGSVIVGADGYNSPVRKFSSIPSFGHAYSDTHALVATLHHQPLHNHTAFQRFLNTGPIAFLPLGETASTLVWSTRPELVVAYKKLSQAGVGLEALVNLGFYLGEKELDQLNEEILSGLVDSTTLASRIKLLLNQKLLTLTSEDLTTLPPQITSIPAPSIASFPLKLSHAESYIGERTVLVGDAAHTVHPLAGQGLNMGLGDVRCLAEVWGNVAERGGDFGELGKIDSCPGFDIRSSFAMLLIGAYTALLPYAKARYPANHLLLSATDKMHHLFRNRFPLINWGRSIGMDIVNELGPVKKAFMNNAGAEAKKKTHGSVGSSRGTGYETGANAFDGWLQAKSVAGLVAGAGTEMVKNGARRLLERIAK